MQGGETAENGEVKEDDTAAKVSTTDDDKKPVEEIDAETTSGLRTDPISVQHDADEPPKKKVKTSDD